MITMDDSRRTEGSSESRKTLSFEDFQKVEMKIGKIKSAKPVEGATKLLNLTIDVGAETRQIVAGMAGVYTTDQLVGMNVVVVMNLEPKKLRGIVSQGMVLAADAESGPVLLVPDKDVPAGTAVR